MLFITELFLFPEMSGLRWGNLVGKKPKEATPRFFLSLGVLAAAPVRVYQLAPWHLESYILRQENLSSGFVV